MQAGIVLGILTVIALVIISSVRKMRALKAAQKQLLEQSGFSPCEAETDHLEEIVSSLRDSSRFKVKKPWKRRSVRGGDVYWYEVGSGDQDDTSAAEEFLCSLRRSSSEPFLLYLRPPMLKKGLGSRLMEKVLTVTAPRGMHKLDLSGDAKSDALLAAFGPRESSLHELVDAEQLAVLAQGARHGVFAIRGVGDHCALELYGSHARKAVEHGGWLDTWSFVQRVMV